MPDEINVRELQPVANLDHVARVAAQRPVAVEVELGNGDVAGARVIEEDHPSIFRERWPDVAPHRLVAAKTMREHDWSPVGLPRSTALLRSMVLIGCFNGAD